MLGRTTVTTSKTIFSPFNIIAGIIVVFGTAITIVRFTKGLAAVTNLSDYNPWGIWIGFDLLVGVALAAGGFVASAAVYIFGMKKYHSAVRPAILTGFLGYTLVVIALHYDVGRPWRLPYPFLVQQGTTSVLFEVGACVALYLTVLFLEFSPVVLEWIGFERTRNLVMRLTLILTIFGVVLSTLHQSSLGSLFLIAPSKMHPLWYSQHLPIYFFVTAVIAGLSMVIFEGALAHKFFLNKMDESHLSSKGSIAIGFGKSASFILIGYFVIKIFGISLSNNWHYIFSGYGVWYLVEMLGFVALPAFVYAIGVRERNIKLIQIASVWTVLGVMLNRFNVSLIAFNWHLPLNERYLPHWMELVISVYILTIGLLIYRFVVTRMPVLYSDKSYNVN